VPGSDLGRRPRSLLLQHGNGTGRLRKAQAEINEVDPAGQERLQDANALATWRGSRMIKDGRLKNKGK